MDHDHRMGRLDAIRKEQLMREHGHPEGQGHMHSEHHSLHGMMAHPGHEMYSQEQRVGEDHDSMLGKPYER